jgi:MFS family permease
MVGLRKIEDRPTPPCVYNFRVYMCSAVAACAAIMIGYDSAFIGGTIVLPSFEKEFGLNTKSAADLNFISANIVSTYQGGWCVLQYVPYHYDIKIPCICASFFGAIFGYPIGYFIGRKRGLLISSLVFIIGTCMMLGANGSRGLNLIYIGRVIAGIGIGCASNLTPIYISEARNFLSHGTDQIASRICMNRSHPLLSVAA